MASDLLLRALRREPVDRTPVWFMRQAGRYLPEYRELRGDRDILESIRRPEEAVEITLQPLRRMPVDAAIVFSDIVVPLVAVGLPIRIVQGRGPVLDDPIRDDAGVERLRPLEPDADEPYVVDAIGWRYAFMPLAIGPALGVWAMARLRAHPASAKLAGGRR